MHKKGHEETHHSIYKVCLRGAITFTSRIYRNVAPQVPVDGHEGCFQLGTVMNNVAMSILSPQHFFPKCTLFCWI